jgi:hypothetical protein
MEIVDKIGNRFAVGGCVKINAGYHSAPSGRDGESEGLSTWTNIRAWSSVAALLSLFFGRRITRLMRAEPKAAHLVGPSYRPAAVSEDGKCAKNALTTRH